MDRGKTKEKLQQSKLVFCKNANKCTCRNRTEMQGVGSPEGGLRGQQGQWLRRRAIRKHLGVKWGCLQGKAQ